ncbi:hypothetical protein SNE40_003148 [Patella caerulea]|uniref:Uncharacterized protein n=1 Tax=Patella caerulea TaxID=87958 RepID=A0AAN8Q0K5_PATCE
MWQKALIQVCLVTVYLCCVLTLTTSLPVSGQGYDLDVYRRLYRPVSRIDLGLFPKRGCSGFPCMYTHLGAKAGRQALMRSLMSIIDDCANDPSCSPGKRRKRSLRAQADIPENDYTSFKHRNQYF